MKSSPKWFLGGVLPILLLWSAQDRADSPDRAMPQIAGIKMTVRTVLAWTSREQTIYVGGDRKRMDYRNETGGAKRDDGSMEVHYGPRVASITRVTWDR